MNPEYQQRDANKDVQRVKDPKLPMAEPWETTTELDLKSLLYGLKPWQIFQDGPFTVVDNRLGGNICSAIFSPGMRNRMRLDDWTNEHCSSAELEVFSTQYEKHGL